MSTAHCCRLCGATSYRPVMAREGGAMRASGLYRCSGCSVVFEDPKSWREAGPDWLPGAPPAVPPPAVKPIVSPKAPDLSSYGRTPRGDG
jgi:hypothetical protein